MFFQPYAHEPHLSRFDSVSQALKFWFDIKEVYVAGQLLQPTACFFQLEEFQEDLNHGWLQLNAYLRGNLNAN